MYVSVASPLTYLKLTYLGKDIIVTHKNTCDAIPACVLDHQVKLLEIRKSKKISSTVLGFVSELDYLYTPICCDFKGTPKVNTRLSWIEKLVSQGCKYIIFTRLELGWARELCKNERHDQYSSRIPVTVPGEMVLPIRSLLLCSTLFQWESTVRIGGKQHDGTARVMGLRGTMLFACCAFGLHDGIMYCSLKGYAAIETIFGIHAWNVTIFYTNMQLFLPILEPHFMSTRYQVQAVCMCLTWTQIAQLHYEWL